MTFDAEKLESDVACPKEICMDCDGSVTQYLCDLKQGDSVAAQKIWERFLNKLIRLADYKLKSSPRQATNEEDIVQQAFAQFFIQVQQGRFAKLNDRNDLWQVLATLVDRRAKDQIRKQHSQKAGGGRVRTESAFPVRDHLKGTYGISQIPDGSPSPDLVNEFVEEFRDRLESLEDRQQRDIALLKMQGYTNREIAGQLQSSIRTVERRLEQIRHAWGTDNRHES